MSVAELRPPDGGVYLRSCLAPLAHLLERPEVTDIYVNRPHEIWVETLGGEIERLEDSGLGELLLERLARQIAALTHQGVSREHPLLSAKLPDGSRIQVVFPPATRGPLALAIRRQAVSAMTLDDYVAGGHFADTTSGETTTSLNDHIKSRIAKRDFAGALSLAVKGRKNIIVSGGTSSGKTTFLNALLREIPNDERLILVEDTPELAIGHPNHVGLVTVRGELGEAKVTANDLLSACLRMRPDRIILGELRGSEAFAFLRVINSGHPGSMTTVHADSPASAIDQLTMLVLQGGTSLTRDDVRHFIKQSIDMFVQLGRESGRRSIDTVMFSE
jgi:type IV secretion system protein VirB11